MNRALKVALLLSIGACSGETTAAEQAQTSATALDQALPAPWKKFTSNSGVTATIEGSNVVVRTSTVPDHRSPYFAMTDSRYEAYNGTNPAFMLNPNRIASQQIVLRIPLNPSPAASPAATPLGPIGIALNGVPFFNQYAAGGAPLTNEVNSFDQYDGHPQNSGMYHYHVEPFSLTARLGKDALLGFLLDGYPVYGPVENGANVAESALDASHGHTHATPDYPSGIYHYHVTATPPYINGNGFHGAPGTTG
jgi:hypothetical protein